jgi:hypothetical protein
MYDEPNNNSLYNVLKYTRRHIIVLTYYCRQQLHNSIITCITD